MQVVKPPAQLLLKDKRFKLFLAGSIENNTAERWQQKIEDALKNGAGNEDLDVIIYNPRRDNWDPTLNQSSEEPRFVEQVNWELDALDDADMIVIYFQPGTMSPISLLELGLYAERQRLEFKKQVIVCCPEGFWRTGNVSIVCKRYNIARLESFDDFVKYIRIKIIYAIQP